MQLLRGQRDCCHCNHEGWQYACSTAVDNFLVCFAPQGSPGSIADRSFWSGTQFGWMCWLKLMLHSICQLALKFRKTC